MRRGCGVWGWMWPVCVAVVAAGCPAASGAGKSPRPRLPPLVAVTTVELQDVPVEITKPLDLRPLMQADVGSKVLGYLDAVLVDRGDRVKKGQVVAVVRPSDLPDQLSAARATQAQAEANLQRARLEFERAQTLSRQGAISQQQVDYQATVLRTAEAAVDATRAQVAALGTRLGETRILAPMDGVVSQRRLDPGALVGGAGTPPILTVERADVLRAFVPVPEHQAGALAVGQAAFVELDALRGRRFPGKVVRMAPSFDVASRTLDAEVHVANADGALRAGMYGRGSIVTATHQQVPVVPVSALQVSMHGRHVFLLNGDKVERRNVETGVDGDTWVEITAGLKGGEEVVQAGVELLSDGVQVRVSRQVDPITGRPLTPPPARSAQDPVPAPTTR
ncbi:MAG: efflux RND transporter periplasmic adaptor subunit [Deltaproteobacteria bacterium]|nr:efflux RND transporter periplasmic adaptor subunit [Deltaproteobacteria bacterium]